MRARVWAMIGMGFLGCGCAQSSAAPARATLELPQQILAPDALVFGPYDADGDRRISATELEAAAEAEFAALAQGRARIPLADVQDWLAAVFGDVDYGYGRVGFDPNFDGEVTGQEFRARLRERFVELDKNADGAIARREFWRRMPRLPQDAPTQAAIPNAR